VEKWAKALEGEYINDLSSDIATKYSTTLSVKEMQLTYQGCWHIQYSGWCYVQIFK